jgi:hypothetical protein
MRRDEYGSYDLRAIKSDDDLHQFPPPPTSSEPNVYQHTSGANIQYMYGSVIKLLPGYSWHMNIIQHGGLVMTHRRPAATGRRIYGGGCASFRFVF